jgi:precorrin isomerase
MILNGEVRPRLVIAMPVGFVNVLEAKQLIMETEVPHMVLAGRRGGSPLAVAALHGIMESGGPPDG